MLSTASELQAQNIRDRSVFLTLTKILDLPVIFHQVCKKEISDPSKKSEKRTKNNSVSLHLNFIFLNAVGQSQCLSGSAEKPSQETLIPKRETKYILAC